MEHTGRSPDTRRMCPAMAAAAAGRKGKVRAATAAAPLSVGRGTGWAAPPLSVGCGSGLATAPFSVGRGSGSAELVFPIGSSNGVASASTASGVTAVPSSPLVDHGFTSTSSSASGFPFPALWDSAGSSPVSPSFGRSASSDLTCDKNTHPSGAFMSYFRNQFHNFHLVGAPAHSSPASIPLFETNGGSSSLDVEILSDKVPCVV